MLSDIRKKISSAYPSHLHHKPSRFSGVLGEIVFGSEDGMVSTMGAVTGIAAASNNHFITILSGLVIIAVESISMAVGSYISTKSEKEHTERLLQEEKIEINDLPEIEELELVEMYKEDGWPAELSIKMAQVARNDSELFLKEMAYRELKVIPEEKKPPLKSGVAMGISYILGGSIPLFPYFLIESNRLAIPVSISITLFSLFALGIFTTKFTNRNWLKAGLEMFSLASLAAFVGFIVGQLAKKIT